MTCNYDHSDIVDSGLHITRDKRKKTLGELKYIRASFYLLSFTRVYLGFYANTARAVFVDKSSLTLMC